MNKDHLDSRCESCIIRELNSFNALNKEDLSKISDVKQVISFKKGEQVFIEGQKLKGVYCIKSGNTKLSKISDNGNSQIVKIARKGELLGKRSLISEESIYIHRAYPLYKYLSLSLASEIIHVHRIF